VTGVRILGAAVAGLGGVAMAMGDPVSFEIGGGPARQQVSIVCARQLEARWGYV
jgi:hypothetical protein